MRFDFTEEQRALRDVARELFAKESPPSRLRDLWDGRPRDDAVWRRLAVVGITGLTVSEEHGGSGGDELDLCLVLEEAGRAALPEPLVECVAVAAPLLAEAGTPEQRERWLPAIASGEALATVGLDAYALDADVADVVCCEVGAELHAVPRDRVTAEPVGSMDGTRRLFRVEVDAAEDTRMDTGADAARRAWLRGAWGTACMLVGVAQRLEEMTLEHVRTREQFGRPVGSFQAVKHKLASVHTITDGARAATWYAAYALARYLADAETAVAVGKVRAAEAARLANTEALQCHGGIGFTWEHDLHLWLKRGKTLEGTWGTADTHRTRIAAEVFG